MRVIKGFSRLLACLHVLPDLPEHGQTNERGYKILTEERSLHTSQCYLGPAKAYGLITPVPSHHINREDGEQKRSWVLQRDGKPAALHQPVTDTRCIQRHLAQSVATRIKLAQIINLS